MRFINVLLTYLLTYLLTTLVESYFKRNNIVSSYNPIRKIHCNRILIRKYKTQADYSDSTDLRQAKL